MTSLVTSEERLVSDRLTAAKIDHIPEPEFIIEGQRPDFLIRVPIEMWLEVKSIGEGAERASVNRRVDEIWRLRPLLPAGRDTSFRVSQATTYKHIEILAAVLRQHDVFNEFEIVCCALSNDAHDFARVEMTIGDKRTLVLFNSYPEKSGWPFEFYNEFPFGDLTVVAADGARVVVEPWHVFGGDDPLTYFISSRTQSKQTAMSLAYSGGATTSKKRQRARDLLRDAHGKARNAQLYINAPAVALFACDDRSEFKDVIDAVLGQITIGFDPIDPRNHEVRRISPFFREGANQHLCSVIIWDKKKTARLLNNPYAIEQADRNALGALIQSLTQRMIACRKGAVGTHLTKSD